jgi:molybdopterin-guanine dinucleotide biosynthesis protein A
MTGSTAAIVLAGGASSRFGADKLLVPLHGRPLLHHAVGGAASVAEVVVVVIGPGALDPVLPGIPGTRVVVARDVAARRGPLAGLAAGLSALSTLGGGALVADPVLLVGGDMPTLVPSVLRALVAALEADEGLGAATLEADPPAILPMAVRPSLAGPAAAELLALDRRALRGLLARVPSAVIPAGAWRALDPDGRTLRDVDAPGDMPGGPDRG